MNGSRPDLWRSRLAAFSSSGLSVKDWCLAEGFPLHQFYYWKRRLSTVSESDACNWALVSVAEPGLPAVPSITVRIGEAAIDLVRGFDAELLRDIVTALGGRAAC